jgi:hypothetical protein
MIGLGFATGVYLVSLVLTWKLSECFCRTTALLYVGALVKEKRSSYVPQPIPADEAGSVWGRIAATPDHIAIRSTR